MRQVAALAFPTSACQLADQLAVARPSPLVPHSLLKADTVYFTHLTLLTNSES